MAASVIAGVDYTREEHVFVVSRAAQLQITPETLIGDQQMANMDMPGCVAMRLQE